MKKYTNLKSSIFSLVFILLLTPQFLFANSTCNVAVQSANGNITVTGLTADANTKLFDNNIASVWECNPWNGAACSENEVIPNLIVGETYFLSVQSSECEEWIPVEVVGGDQPNPTELPPINCSNFQNADEAIGSYLCGEATTDGVFTIITDLNTSADEIELVETSVAFEGGINTTSIASPATFDIENNQIVEKDALGSIISSIALPSSIVTQFGTNNAGYIGVAQTSTGNFWLQGYVRNVTSNNGSGNSEQGNDIKKNSHL